MLTSLPTGISLRQLLQLLVVRQEKTNNETCVAAVTEFDS